MLLGVFILQHSAMKRLQLKERLQVGTGEKKPPYLIPVIRMPSLATLKGACTWDQQTSACSSSSTSGLQAPLCSGSWILT